MKNFTCKPMAVLTIIFFTCITTAYAASLNISGNYIYKGSSEKLVLTFHSKGVVLFRRYEKRYAGSRTTFSKTPIESTWMPYITKNKSSGKALICQYSNPKGTCWAQAFTVTGKKVKWGGITFIKTQKSFAKSKYDKGPYSFSKLKNIYRAKMSLIK